MATTGFRYPGGIIVFNDLIQIASRDSSTASSGTQSSYQTCASALSYWNEDQKFRYENQKFRHQRKKLRLEVKEALRSRAKARQARAVHQSVLG
jgi:hypothetical protein